MPPKTYVYVDGFNLYYGAVKDTPYKWLDIRKLCELMLKDHAIHKVKYFTAKVHGHVGDPRAPQRQQIFLRALARRSKFRDRDSYGGKGLRCQPWDPFGP